MRNKKWNDDSDEFDRNQLDRSDFGDESYLPCPHCGETMLEDADYCPSCDRWMTDGDTTQPRSSLWVIVVAALLLAFLLTSVLRGF